MVDDALRQTRNTFDVLDTASPAGAVTRLLCKLFDERLEGMYVVGKDDKLIFWRGDRLYAIVRVSLGEYQRLSVYTGVAVPPRWECDMAVNGSAEACVEEVAAIVRRRLEWEGESDETQ